jgi:hypothetical protein
MHCRLRRVVWTTSIIVALSAGVLGLTPSRAEAAPSPQAGCWGPCPPVPGPWGTPAMGPWMAPPDPIAQADAVAFTGYVNLTNAIGYQNVVNAVTYQNLANAAAYRNMVRVATYRALVGQR